MRKIDRFLQFLKYKGINENRATVECGLSQGLLNQAKSGKADLGQKTLEKILTKYQDLNNVWLLTGEGEMIKNSGNFIQGDVNGGVVQSGGRQQNINISLPSEGEQKIIRPDGTVEIQTINSNGEEYERRIKDLEQIISTQKELIETLKLLVSKN